jgi:hypothetical protein
MDVRGECRIEGETCYNGARDMLQGIEQEEGVSCLLGGSFVGHGDWWEG